MSVENRSIVEVLADFLSSLAWEDFPEEVVDKGKYYMTDVIGCIIAGSSEKQARLLVDVLKAEGGNPHSTVFMHGIKTSALNAALANGTMGHILEFDDDNREATMHPSVAVFPAVFALGEKLKANGKALLKGFILGLEVMIRVGKSLLGKSYYQGFHPTGTCGVFGAAAGCAVTAGLDARHTKYALGIAGSFSAGTQECTGEGAWQKPLQAGHPAMGGVLAALLAEKGFVGSGTVLDGPNGLLRALSYKDQWEAGIISDQLGKKWEMMETSIKVHACCRFLGPVVDCALELYNRGVRPENVAAIVAGVCDFSVRMLCYPVERKLRPKTHVDAQFSLPYSVAVAICKGKAGVEEFREEVLADSTVLELAKKVRWEVDPLAEAAYPRSYPATLVAELKDGRKLQVHVDFPKGDPENPVTKEELLRKFHLLTERHMSREKRERILDMVWNMDRVEDVNELGDLVRQ